MFDTCGGRVRGRKLEKSLFLSITIFHRRRVIVKVHKLLIILHIGTFTLKYHLVGKNNFGRAQNDEPEIALVEGDEQEDWSDSNKKIKMFSMHFCNKTNRTF